MAGLTPRRYKKSKQEVAAPASVVSPEEPVALRPTRFREKTGVVGTAYYQLLWCTRNRKPYLGNNPEEAKPCSEAIDKACESLGGRLVFQGVSPDGVFLIVGEISPVICIYEIVTAFKRHIWAELIVARPDIKKRTSSIWDRKYWFATVQSSDDMDTEALRASRRVFINAQAKPEKVK
jgi:hypothetical protein